jgi:hypothetical protein
MSLRAAAESSQNVQGSSLLQTPSGHWQSMRRHGSADLLASKARSYIQGLLKEPRN